MPRLIITEGAVDGLDRCRLFLVAKNPDASRRAGATIDKHLGLLERNPEIGRRLNADSDFRELKIGFGRNGYVALYRYDTTEDVIYVLAFRHQREAGY